MITHSFIGAVSLWFVIGYLSGSIPYGLLIAKAFGLGNLRTIGSGNIGATNVRRTVGTLPALATLVGDIGKGFLPVWWAQALVSPGVSPWAQGYLAAVGLCALAGHLYPVFLKFRTGGKGVATAAGCLLAVSPGALGVSGLVFVMTACGLNRVSAASLAATAAMPLAATAETVLIQAGQLLVEAGEPALAQQTVVVEDGRISRVVRRRGRRDCIQGHGSL